MTTLSNAIKVSIQATKEASSASKIHHTALLNNIASRLGYKNFRALVASEAKPVSEKQENKNPSSFNFEPFTLLAYSSDDMASVVSYKVDGDVLSRLFELSTAAKNVVANVPHDFWQEEEVASRTSMATRPVVSSDGGVFIDAEIYDKHSCENMSVYGEVNLHVLYSLVSGVNPENNPAVTFDYIWDAKSRAFYLLSDVCEPSDWIKDDGSDGSGLSDLLDQYDNLSASEDDQEV